MTPDPHPITLTRYLIEQRRRFPEASGALNALLLDVALACRAIAHQVAQGQLAPATPAGEVNVQGEVQQPLDLASHAQFLRMNEGAGHLAGMASEELAAPHQIPAPQPRGKYLLAFDPLDGSSNIDVNAPVGSIFSVLRAPAEAVASGRDVNEADFLQPGCAQVAAGYALYGPTTMLVLSVGSGVAGFTLDPQLGEFMCTHPDIRVPPATREFAINASNSRFWEAPIKRYIDECLAGQTGPRDKDFNMRWIASLVAEAHRILVRGGVFLYPRDSRASGGGGPTGRLRLLYEANPIGFLIEQAGGRASTGRGPVLEAQPTALHQRTALVFGSRQEVERIERYHAEPQGPRATPLFAERGLFSH